MSVDTSSLGANSLIRNTVTNRNTIAPVLYSICTNNNASIVLLGDEAHDLNATDVYQAVCVPGGQPVDLSSATAAGEISVGPDTSARALEWMAHLNLLDAGRTVLMKFYVSGSKADQAANLVNGDSTQDHIVIRRAGGADSNSVPLISQNDCAGKAVLVEVSCEDASAGSEVVVFNVLPGYWFCD